MKNIFNTAKKRNEWLLPETRSLISLFHHKTAKKTSNLSSLSSFMASLLFYLNVSQAMPSNPSRRVLFPALNSDKTTTHASFPSRNLFTSQPIRVIRSRSLLSNIPPVLVETEGGFYHEHTHAVEEDPRPLQEIWREVQGQDDWEGLLDPLNSHLRREILRYGEFAQSCYDSFDFDPHSKYCGSCKYQLVDFFEKMDMMHYGYHMCR